MSSRNMFDVNAFRRGLQEMSQEIQSSAILAPYRPLELIASGGFVSVVCLRNRTATQDLDYFLHPEALGRHYDRIKAELSRITVIVATRLNYIRDWANDHVSIFLTLLDNPTDLFERSKRQNIVLFQDPNIKIFAVLWEWVLVRKLKRIQMEDQEVRGQDWSDCIAICKVLHRQRPEVLNTSMLTQFDHTEREPPVLPNTFVSLRRLLVRHMGLDPFASGAASTVPVPRAVAGDGGGTASEEGEDSDEQESDSDNNNSPTGHSDNTSEVRLRIQQAIWRRDQLVNAGHDRSAVIAGLATMLAEAIGIDQARAQQFLSQ